MHARWRHLLEPMSLAAYLAWGAIGVQLVTRAPTATGLLEGPLLLPLVLGMHASFLVLFVAVHLLPADQERPVLGLVLAQAVAALAMLALVRDSAAPILLIIAMAQVAQLLRPRGMALVFVAVNTVFLLELLWFWKAGAATWVFLVSHASFQLFAMVASWYAITARRSRDELAALNADLLSTRSLLAESVRDSERLRLARELHDVAGHKLTALKLNLAALRRQPELSTHAQLALCGELADELLGDLRAVVQQMRLHDGVALRQILEGIAAPFPRPRLHLEMAQGLRVETFEQAEAVVRTVQEALTNSARHGTADNLWLSLRREGDALRLELRDDGRGSGKLRFGNGLTGMRERLHAIGGGLVALLEGFERLRVCVQAGDGAALLEALADAPVDVILSDIRMPGLDGFGLLAGLQARGDATPVILLTTFDEPELALRAAAAGARGFLLKDASPEDLLEAIVRVAAGETLLAPVPTDPVRARYAYRDRSEPTDTFSEREVAILRLLAGGYSNKEIARAVFLSEGTVKNYVSDILDKLGTRDRTRAVLKAITLRVI